MPILESVATTLLTGGSIKELLGGIPIIGGIKGSHKPLNMTGEPQLSLFKRILSLKNEKGNIAFSDYGARLAVRHYYGDMPNRDEKDRKEAALAKGYWESAMRLDALPINSRLAEIAPPIQSGPPGVPPVGADVTARGPSTTTGTILILGIVGLVVIVGMVWAGKK